MEGAASLFREPIVDTLRSCGTTRRRFLKYLAASPLLALGDRIARAAESWDTDPANRGLIEQWIEPVPETGALIGSPAEAISVFDFERVARHVLPPAHYGYLASGVEDNSTLIANRTGFDRIQLRPRVLVDVRQADTSVALFGETWKTPISLAPIGQLRAFHDDGEIAVANAARTTGHQMILSTVATASVEEVTAAKGGPIWFQLYPMWNWDVTQRLVGRADAAGCRVCAITVDMPTGRKSETFERFRRLDDRTCSDCHNDFFDRKPMFFGLPRVSGEAHDEFRQALTWDFARRVKGVTRMKVLVKGVLTGEDAQRCIDAGVDGIVVSNHGGRAAASAPGTIEALPEVVATVNGRMPIIVDGGIRRGTDIFKALALGADAISIGRPYVWGLAAFGEAGVEAVLRMLTEELVRAMKMDGVTSLAEIDRSRVTVGKE